MSEEGKEKGRCNNSPLVSVIIPVYNVEEYLVQCVDSVRNQTYKNIEIFLVDDGSTDQSGEICDFYSSIDDRIHVIHKKNGGLSSARNAGIELANGEYFAFIDSDDYADLEMIEVLCDRVIKAQAEIAFGGYETIDETGSQLKCRSINKNYTSFEALQALSGDTGIPLGTIWNKIYKRSLFDNIRFPLGKYHEDVFIMHELIDLCSTVCGVDKTVYYYRQRNGSITKSIYSVRHLDNIEAFYVRYCYYKKKGQRYRILLQSAGEDVATVYYQSKLRFKPANYRELLRVKETDKMARDVCFDRFKEWSIGLKLKLLVPHFLAFLSNRRKYK